MCEPAGLSQIRVATRIHACEAIRGQIDFPIPHADAPEPAGLSSTASGRISDAARLPVVWEGSFFETHSLSIVNRELTLSLLDTGQVDLSLRMVQLEPIRFDPRSDERTRRYPKWWHDHEEASLNAHEAELLTEHMRELTGRAVPVHYEKVFTAADGEGLLKRLPAHLAKDGVTALVFNFIDQLTHGRTENSTLFEVARDTPALRNLTRTWFERSPLWDALREAERRGVPVLLTTDHGSIHCHTPATVFAKRDTTSNLRYKFGEDLRAQDPEAAVVVDDLASFGLPTRTPGTRLLLATGDRFFVYPTKLREYQARYRGAFLHGGVSPEEVLLPIALLTPRQG